MKTNHRMEFDPEDQKVVELLAKLKNKNGGYPPDMLESRRQSYLNHMAGLGLGAGFGTVLKNAIKNGNGAGFSPPTAGTLLEVVLVVAIIAEAGTLAYFYRDKVADFFQSISTAPKTQEVAPPPVIQSPIPELEISEVPISAISTGTITEMPTSTPVPVLVLTEDPTINNSGGANLTSSTPNPSGNNGNNGNHYGQTPKPERTKENNKDKPPKDDPGNGNNDKPPKEKDKNK